MRSTHASDDNDLPRISKQIHVRINRTVAPRTSWRTVERQVQPYGKLYIFCAQRVTRVFGLFNLIKEYILSKFQNQKFLREFMTDSPLDLDQESPFLQAAPFHFTGLVRIFNNRFAVASKGMTYIDI